MMDCVAVALADCVMLCENEAVSDSEKLAVGLAVHDAVRVCVNEAVAD